MLNHFIASKYTNHRVVDDGAVSADEASGRRPGAVPPGQYAPGRGDGSTGTHIFIITKKNRRVSFVFVYRRFVFFFNYIHVFKFILS